jgi:ElaB/YqjD/DUF883 family membrane-anchored ribosome-binding protein
MERNTGDSFGTQGAGQSGSTGGAGASFGGGIGGSTGTQGYGSTGGAGGVGGSTGGAGGAGGALGGASGLADEAQGRFAQGKDAVSEKLGQARDVASDKLGALKEKAGSLTASLADTLEAGAEKLRQRGQQGGAQGGDGATAVAGLEQYSGQLATGLQSTADWLREGDLKASIETQVKEHPGRTLLIALGVGYVIGKSLRK